MSATKWVLCPICNQKTRIKVREDTILENFPLYCPKCHRETLIAVHQLIRRVDVYRGYQLNITFNFDLTPYIEGDDAAAC